MVIQQARPPARPTACPYNTQMARWMAAGLRDARVCARTYAHTHARTHAYTLTHLSTCPPASTPTIAGLPVWNAATDGITNESTNAAPHNLAAA